MLGSILLALIVIAAIVGIWVTPYDPTLFAVRFRLQAPSLLHPFGTDEFGRDVLSRILAGAHLSLATGFGAMAISLVVGVPLGLLAAFHRGLVQEVIMRAVDLLIALPPVLLGLLVLAVTPPGLLKTIAAVGLVYVPILVRPDSRRGDWPLPAGRRLRAGCAARAAKARCRSSGTRSCPMPGRPSSSSAACG